MKAHKTNCIECERSYTMTDSTKWPTFRNQAEDKTGTHVRMEIQARRWFRKKGDDRLHTKYGGLCADCLEKCFVKILTEMRKGKDMGTVLTCRCGCQQFEIHAGSFQCTKCEKYIKMHQEYLNLDNEENTFSLDLDGYNEAQ